jgi:uncharacterized protein YbaP (TraB family)
LDVTNELKYDAMMIHIGTMKQAFLNKHAQSCLKPARALVVETWMVLISICHVP